MARATKQFYYFISSFDENSTARKRQKEENMKLCHLPRSTVVKELILIVCDMLYKLSTFFVLNLPAVVHGEQIRRKMQSK